MNNDIRLDLNKTQQYKNIRLEYLTPSTEIYIYKSYRFRKSGARCALNVNLLSRGFPLYNTESEIKNCRKWSTYYKQKTTRMVYFLQIII